MTPRSCSSFCHLIFHIKLGFHILERGILSCTDCGQTFGLDPRNKISNMSNIFTSNLDHVWSESLNILICVQLQKMCAFAQRAKSRQFMFYICCRDNNFCVVWKKQEKGFSYSLCDTGKSHSQISFVTKDFFYNTETIACIVLPPKISQNTSTFLLGRIPVNLRVRRIHSVRPPNYCF